MEIFIALLSNLCSTHNFHGNVIDKRIRVQLILAKILSYTFLQEYFPRSNNKRGISDNVFIRVMQ